MSSRVREFLQRHPLVRDAAVWALPAILFGAVLRLLMLHYSPYAYWGSDSRSYYSFAHMLLDRGDISLDEKRRYLYPILMLLVSVLPGAPLKWLAWLQHGFGLLTLIPLAYVLRKTLFAWRWWIVPLTVVFAGMPMVLWYEHELLGETLFFALVIWAMAGWCAWVGEERLGRARSLFWWFFVPLALFLLTKPSGRFVVPGICVGLLLAGVWRKLNRIQVAALIALAAVTLTVGSKKQAAWLLYVATFPLTQLDSPLHAEYKAEIRDLVEPLRRDIHAYYLLDEVPFNFLENPGKQDERPLWKALDRDAQQRSKVYMDLALEGIKAEPARFLYLAVQRAIASANLSDFKEYRFTPDYYPMRLEHHYEKAREDVSEGRSTPLRVAFGWPRNKPLPPYEEFRKLLSPAPDSFAPRVILSWVKGYEAAADLAHMPRTGEVAERRLSRARVTVLGWVLLLGGVLALLPAYRSTLGVWVIVAVGYVLGVFLVSQLNPRYFAPVWPMLLPLLAVPFDLLMRRYLARR